MPKYEEEDYLWLSGIQHYEFCPRQWALIHIENLWNENYLTASGRLFHKKVHDKTQYEKRGNIIIVRALKISSANLGLSGECDVVEFHKDKNGIKLKNFNEKYIPYPIEFKRGNGHAILSDEMQLCAQAMCLEEMLCCDIPKGALFYGEPKRRKVIEFSQELRNKVANTVFEMHKLFKKLYTPKPIYKNHCRACSMQDFCLPKISKQKSVKEYIKEVLLNEEIT
ncbi:MAG: CRISPR-associated protein Cas4 [Clostridia bacterium]|nr:CRISPR-associated protein Cas4 [Clostridia bacterium]MDD4686042.1 CRISPR-associated protein Cas4 [Clostridia bacterium]